MEVVQYKYKAKVTNLSTRPHEEKFKGEIIRFEPGETKIFPDWTEAVQFRGQFVPVLKNDSGSYINEKRIKIEKIPDPDAAPQTSFINPLNGKTFASKDELVRDVQYEAQKGGYTAPSAEAPQASEVAALKAEMAALKAMLTPKTETKAPRSRTRKKKVEHDTESDTGSRS
jgi:hypothetical protein